MNGLLDFPISRSLRVSSYISHYIVDVDVRLQSSNKFVDVIYLIIVL